MIKLIKQYTTEVELFTISSKEDIEKFRIKFLGKHGILSDLFNQLKKVPLSDKKEYGKIINLFKNQVHKKLKSFNEFLNKNQSENKFQDLSKPGICKKLGSRHPISIIKNKILEILSNIGFKIVTDKSPEIETDWYNFTALNLPNYHPARDMQDTFFIKNKINDNNSLKNYLLRTHTSSVQIRYTENHKPPIRIITPGRVFRNETISSRSHCMFHQIEGIYIDEYVSFCDLKQTLLFLCEALFGMLKIRFRPSYFPFTEPSAEVDIYWGLKNKTDYQITKGSGWLEVLGCGMIHPNVLNNMKINSEKYSGYAFGIGIERIAMMLYQIDDVRIFFKNDIQWLAQFKSENI